MPATVFFSYFLRQGVDPAEFEQQILREVRPAALAENSVNTWTLHRTIAAPGTSEDSPSYVCVVEINDLTYWSESASESILATHGGLGSMVSRIALTVTTELPADQTDERPRRSSTPDTEW